MSNAYLPSGTSLLKAEFLISLRGVNFSGVLFCRIFFLREQFCFADRGHDPQNLQKLKPEKFGGLRADVKLIAGPSPAHISRLRRSCHSIYETCSKLKSISVTIGDGGFLVHWGEPFGCGEGGKERELWPGDDW